MTTFSGAPYVVSVYGTNLNISSVVINTPTQGSCSGTINGIMQPNGPSWFISVNANLPSATSTCTIVGNLYPASFPPLSITNP
ncbi:MAG: hypothetical protein V4610_14290 [Pseudomonadota bacterium]|jgi:hypothetical protein